MIPRPSWPRYRIATMSRLIPHLLACALCAGGLAGVASAAPPATTADPAPTAQQRPLDRIDTNRDGIISRTEYQAWVEQRYAAFDPDGKGQLGVADLVQSPAFQARAEARAERLIKRYDRTGTGMLSRADFEAGQMARFDRLADGKDSISKADLKAAWRDRGRHGQGARRNSDAGQ